ncbi:hypothetical protein CYMTET_56096 [Cymbomonas tetramitiformis]|uniref:Uncharacterized protein n=1 Tax=Cymbomonas tetramitiformis TaxID=36881 RepID=A0AAE0EM60_9CHLO|nr:hypothetical protein CYMTET_56096 [Cymbomonas tetramitiformis]
MGNVKSEVVKEAKAKKAESAVHSSFQKLGITVDERSAQKLSPDVRAFHTRNFVIMCAVDLRPPEIRRVIGYQFYMSGFNPRWATEPPHHTTLDTTLLHEYEAARERVRATLKAQLDYVKYGPALHGQLDLWTSASGEPYGAFAVCYIDPTTGERCRICLGVRLFPGEHTAADCARWIVELCSDFGLTEKQLVEIFIAGTADGAGKELNAFAKELEIACKVCVGHRLNSALQWSTGLSGTPPTPAKCKGGHAC